MKNNEAPLGALSELAEHGEAERAAVERQRALKVHGPQQDAAGQDIHRLTPGPSGWATCVSAIPGGDRLSPPRSC